MSEPPRARLARLMRPCAEPGSIRLAYGPAPEQFGDLRLPATPGPHPVAMVIHGGFWQAAYDLSTTSHLCADLATRGVASWNIEYRRLGNAGGGWPGTLLDVALAADHLRSLAVAHDFDLMRVIAMGHSAGGQLALWLAARHRQPAVILPAPPRSLQLCGVVALAAVSDLRRAHELDLGGGVVRQLLGGTPAQCLDRYAAASPAALLPLAVPQVIVHGTADDRVPYTLSQVYAAAARSAGDAVSLLRLPGVGHFEPIDPATDAWRSVVAAVLELLVPSDG